VDVESFFARERPDYVFLAAAKVGGIQANASFPVDFLQDNLLIQVNVIRNAYQFGVKKLVFLGSSCIYPKFAPQPIPETALLTGALEPTNDAYAIAKIAGIRLCQAYTQQFGFRAISLMPTNLYGPGDNFDLLSSHVLPALIRKFHEAKVGGAREVVLWGTGTPRREFLHVDDMARACIYLAEHYESSEIVNIGVGEDLAISELAGLVRACVGFEGRIVYDSSKPDGTPRKLLDVTKLRSLGSSPSLDLAEGIAGTYQLYLEHQAQLAKTTHS
jgi:GDP-L-fucose synthase